METLSSSAPADEPQLRRAGPSAPFIPAVLQRILCLLLVSSALIGLVHSGDQPFLPVVLDLWVLLLAAWVLTSGRIVSHAALLIAAGYLLLQLVGALRDELPVADFLQAHRWVVYLAVLALARGHRWSRPDLLNSLAWWLTTLALIEATLALTLQRSGAPSGLFGEAGPGTALLCGLVAVLHPHGFRHRMSLVLLLGALVLLSWSHGAAIAYAAVLVYTVWSARAEDVFLRYLQMLIPLLSLFLSWMLFQARQAGAQAIDQLNLVAALQLEVTPWRWSEWIGGDSPISPPAAGQCAVASPSGDLVSIAVESPCPSTVLQSHLMQLLVDGGAVALLLAFALPVIMLRRAAVSWPLTLTVLAIAIAYSLSAGGLNDPYVALPLLLAVVTAPALVSPSPRPSDPAPSPPTMHRSQESSFRSQGDTR